MHLIIHTEEVISSSLVSPTKKTPGSPGVFAFHLFAHGALCGEIGRLCGIGVRERFSSAVTAGTGWGIPRVHAILVRRNDVDLAVDRSAYFTSDRTAIRATMRVSFAFPHAAAIQRITLSD